MYHAYKTPPEYQESPLYSLGRDWRKTLRETWPGVSIFGNRDFSDAWSEDADGLQDRIEEAADAWRDPYDENRQPSLAGILADNWISRKDGKPWTTKQRHAWREIFEAYLENPNYDLDDATADALQIITGEKYETGTIRGCAQRDWAKVIYPASIGSSGLRALEIEFFNMGEEYQIFSGEKDEPGAEYEVNVYCYSWRDDEKRAELADAAGCAPEEIAIHEFTGWSRAACYD